MPSSIPNIGKHANPLLSNNPKLSSAAEELLVAPENESLGTISNEALQEITETTPPPWEVDKRYGRHNTDARRFVTVPDWWELRWLNPTLVQRDTMRGWESVQASDPRVKVHNRAMIAPDLTVRRDGNHSGDFLAWMPKRWLESKLRMKAEKVAIRTGEARDRQEAVKEQVNRGAYGHYVQVDSATHPTHTMGDGRTMTDV